MRNEDDDVIAAIEEAIFIGSQAGLVTHLAHLKAQGKRNWWKVNAFLGLIDQANASGIPVSFDRYPYVAYSTDLGSLFPLWAREGSMLLDRLLDDSVNDGIRRAVLAKIDRLGDWDAVQVTLVRAEDYRWVQGRRLGTAASEVGRDPYDFLVELTLADRNGTSMVGFGMSEENTAAILSHPRAMVCSDGSARATYGALNEGNPHPRTYGTFPRVLGKYVRELGTMSMESAIQKMTSAPADLIGARDRGRLEVGKKADIAIFDPRKVKDKATFDDPHQYPEGIPFVIVNGQVVIKNGEHSGVRSGEVVRPV